MNIGSTRYVNESDVVIKCFEHFNKSLVDNAFGILDKTIDVLTCATNRFLQLRLMLGFVLSSIPQLRGNHGYFGA